jgi:uncharacterized Zn-finger protein
MQIKSEPFEIIQVTRREVICDGGGGALGHPRVYLHIDADQGEQVTCPYCSRVFKLLVGARLAS